MDMRDGFVLSVFTLLKQQSDAVPISQSRGAPHAARLMVQPPPCLSQQCGGPARKQFCIKRARLASQVGSRSCAPEQPFLTELQNARLAWSTRVRSITCLGAARREKPSVQIVQPRQVSGGSTPEIEGTGI